MKLNITILENRGKVNQIYSFPAVKQIRERCHWYFSIGTLALTHKPLSHILNSLKSDFYCDLEALKTTHNFVILCSSSNHFGIPRAFTKQQS